jgi:ABC-type antimicrobial peptide transport system permease subunit
VTAESLAEQWRSAIDTSAVGFAFRPVRAQALRAATGTTPFNLLFLGFSMFIIAAAVMLVALLFRLAVERRAREVGILLATGWSQQLVRRLLVREGAVIAVCGGALGVAAGVAYAWLMLAGLRTWWVAAVSAPFLQLHITGTSLVIGGLCGIGVSLGAVVWALRNLRGASARQLMSGNTADEARAEATCRGGSLHVARWSMLGAIVLTVMAFKLSGEAQAGAFFGAGGLVLVALMCFVWRRLVLGGGAALVDTRGTSGNSAAIVRLALRNAARHPMRSTLTIGLVSSAAFLIMAISAFHLEPPSSLARRDTGTGGFALVGESSLPLLLNLNDEDGRFDLGFGDAAEKSLTGSTFFPLRTQPGDDASCLNLYQPQQPRVLAISPQLVERGGFEWAGHAAKTDEQRANPWTLLDQPSGKTDAGADTVPVVIDMATAMFSLHLSGVGSRFEIKDDRGTTVTLEVVGLLKNSIFQGRLLIGEAAFLRHFPSVEGYQFFLIDTPAGQSSSVADTLNATLGDYGLSVRSAAEILTEFLAVQNTYLSTFQSLGGLGLLLGTLGLATVQLRNVLERRGELALMRATGFRQSLLARLVFYENAALLIGGLVVGALAALLAILPHLLSGGAAIPWQSLGLTLGAVIVVGLVAGMAAVRAVLETPVLEALRGE